MFFSQISSEFWMDCHVIWFPSCSAQDDPLTFHQAPPTTENFCWTDELVCDQIPAKLLKIPSALAALVFNKALLTVQSGRLFFPCLGLNFISPTILSFSILALAH